MSAQQADASKLSDLSLREASAASHRGRGKDGHEEHRRRSRGRRAWLLLVVAAVVASLVAAVAGGGDLVKPGGFSLVARFFGAAAHPRLDGDFVALTANATLTTLAYAVLGTAVSLVIGLVGGVFSSQVWWRSTGRRRGRLGRRHTALAGWAVTRVLLVLPRGVHEVVWGLFLLSVLGIEPIVAVLAIGIPFGAVTAKVFAEILDETAGRPHAALTAVGASRLTALLYGLLPTALSDLLSYAFYRLECAIRSAAILGLLGVGGLGYQLQLSFQSLRYEEIWTLLGALVLLCAAADAWSWTVRSRRSLARTRTGRDRVIVGSIAAAAVLVPLSAWWVGLSGAPLWDRQSWRLLADLVTRAWPPTLGSSGWGGLVHQAMETLAMSVLAIAVAFGGGMLLAFPAANLSWSGRRAAASGPHRSVGGRAGRVALLAVTRLLLIVLRAIPPPVWALLFLFVLFPGILPAALALGVYTTGVLGRLMAEAAENLDERPLRALRAHGASGLQVFCYGVIPSATPRFVAYGLYRWEVTIRETVVVGVVGAGGLGLALNEQLATFDYGAALGTLLAVIVLTLLADFLSAAMRHTLRR